MILYAVLTIVALLGGLCAIFRAGESAGICQYSRNDDSERG